MPNLKNEKYAILLVLIAGLFWSLGPLVVRNIDDAGTVPWQYLFSRGAVIFILLNCYLFLEEGFVFYKNYLKMGLAGIIGGIGLGTAMITFIWSITNTTAAITLLCLAAMPFITALLGFLFLKEKISISVWIAILIASIGIIIMSFDGNSSGSLTGLMFGLAFVFRYNLGVSIFFIIFWIFIIDRKNLNIKLHQLFFTLIGILVIILLDIFAATWGFGNFTEFKITNYLNLKCI